MAEAPAPEPDDDALHAGRSFAVAAGGLAVLVIVLFVVLATQRDAVLGGARWFVDTLGPWGVALGFFLPDLTALPLPHDVFLALGRLGGLSFGTLVVWASAGSILGGLGAWAAGRAVAGTRWFEARSGKRVRRARAVFSRHGAWALALSAVSPLPYSLLAWAAGGLGMPLGRFAAISLLRIVRVALYLGLIDEGFVRALGS